MGQKINTNQYEPVEQESWQTPSFNNGWENYSTSFSECGYFKNSSGIVHIKGLVKNGTIGQGIFVLPAGYRPSRTLILTVSTNPNVYGQVRITSSGSVECTEGSSNWVSLDGISFRAEQ